MPVQDFSLNAEGMQRVQVFWNSESEPATVKLDDKVIGLLNTARERAEGKDFTLPDGSALRVRFVNNQAQVTRNGSPLGGIRRVVRSTKRPPEGKKRGGCLTAMLVIYVIAGVEGINQYLLPLLGVTKNMFIQQPALLLAFFLSNCIFIIGAIALFAWKKWGFYMIIFAVLCNIVLYYLELTFNPRPSYINMGLTRLGFISPFIGIGLLYYLLRRNDVWQQLA